MPKLVRVPERNVEHAYGVYLLSYEHRLIKRLRRDHQPTIHGQKSWESAYLMMDYLSHHPLPKKGQVMEIGCGWGAISVFCARKYGSKVLAVDLDPAVFPFMNVHSHINAVEISHRCADFSKIKGRELGQYQTIVGSDICFWDSLVKPLVNLATRALKNGAEQIVIADPGRPTFYEFCDLMTRKHSVLLQEWYSVEPKRAVGEIVLIRNKPS